VTDPLIDDVQALRAALDNSTEDVKVGTHHRVPAQAILEFQQARQSRRDKAAEALAAFSNEIGMVD
ncbi:MAG TPA: hypothetical protein PLQ19_09115, partial [Aeromicrobium sp.]|nr:hypothetical protein [Aeromicrobium sp.]